jgi:cytochrome c oxidase subunit 2
VSNRIVTEAKPRRSYSSKAEWGAGVERRIKMSEHDSSFSRLISTARSRSQQTGMRSFVLLCASLLAAVSAWGENKPSPIPNMFAPVSTPAQEEFVLSLFVIGITAGILVVVGGAWAYVTMKYRSTEESDVEPAQVYGSPQVELAWTIVPVIIVVVLFLTTARMIFAIQDNPRPKSALDVTVVGHQFWWEFRYPQYGVVVANEMHVPMSTPQRPVPTFMKLESADVWHSFWVPQLAGKVDNIPDHVNDMWIDPHVPGLYVGQCGQFCGVEHAKMLIRVYVDTPDQFQRWITTQQQPAVEQPGAPQSDAAQEDAAPGSTARQGGGQAGLVKASLPAGGQASNIALGRQVFQQNACMNCHAIQGTNANGQFGPNLTHFGGRDTLGSGSVANNMDNLKAWIRNPSDLKEGALMPPMQLSEPQLEQVSAYLTSLK